MLILTETTDKVQVVLGGAVTTNQLNCVASYRDITTTAFTPGRRVTNTNNTTDVDLVESPASSTQRVVDFISIHNADTTNDVVTVKFDANGTEYIIFKATLAPDERMEYTDAKGWQVYATTGAIKQSINQGQNAQTSSLQAVVLGTDRTNNDAVANTMADVTGLSFSVTSGLTYYFRFVIWYTAAATTTGSRWAINAPAATLLGYNQSWGLSASGTSGTDVFTQNNAGAVDLPAASNTSSPTATAGQANIAVMEGFITPSANGTVIARFASEVSASAIVAKAGSVVYYQQVV